MDIIIKSLTLSLLLNSFFIYKYSKILKTGALNNLKSILRKINTPPSTNNNDRVCCITEKDVFLLQNENRHGSNLPNDKLVINPDYYSYKSKTFNLLTEGLYRFINHNKKSNKQYVVYHNNIHILMSSLSWMISHGHRDDNLSQEKLIKKAMYEKLILTCEPAVKFSFNLLNNLGIKSRVIGSRTLEKWNLYDDGHYLLEVYNHSIHKWILYDLDAHVCFSDDGSFLSLIECMDRFETKNYDLHPLSDGIKVLVGDTANSFDFTFTYESRSNNHLKDWYKRIMQLVFIEHNNDYFSWQLQKPEGKDYPNGAFPKINYLGKKEFISVFY